MNVENMTGQAVADPAHDQTQENTRPFFQSPEPTELRDLVYQAAIDSLQIRGYIAAPHIEQMFPIATALKHLDLYTTDDHGVLEGMLQNIESEKAAAQKRADAGEPNPIRADEVATLPPKKCMDIMSGMFFWSAGLDEDGIGCMVNAGQLIAELYGQWEDAAA